MKYIDDNDDFTPSVIFEIGEQFELERNDEIITLQCVECKDYAMPCTGCAFHDENGGCKPELKHLPFVCSSPLRPDGKEVIFVETK